MPATDAQMQTYVDQRIRPRAEQLRAAFVGMADDKNANADVYDRAVNGPAWNDARTDGPPNLATSQDVLVYDSICVLFAKVIAGTATLEDIGQIAANWPVFQSMCVRPLGG